MREEGRRMFRWLWAILCGCTLHQSAVQSALAQPSTVVVYSNDFTRGDTAHWSTTVADPEWQRHVRVRFTGNATQRVLGDFGDQRVTLRLPQLPPHDSITIVFDFIAIRSWDGNSSLYGPDLLEFKIDDTLLFRTSFSNTSYRQSFPGDYPASRPARSGAAAFNSLGYIWRFPNLFSGPMDATYRIARTIPHTANQASFHFSVMLDDPGQDITNESWALDNVTVTATTVSKPAAAPPQPQPPQPSQKKREPATGG